METKAMLRLGYDRTAGVYDQAAGDLYLMGLRRLLPYAAPPVFPAILDAGCGTGTNLFEADRVFGPCSDLVGVDLSPAMVAAAEAKAAARGLPARFIVADVEALPAADQHFDLVICNSAYHWFCDRQRAVGEFARVLRPGGQLLLNSIAAPGFGEWMAMVRQVWQERYGPWERYGPREGPWFPALPTREELQAHLRAAGLEIQLLNHLVQPVLIADLPRFVRTMAAVSPNWLSGLPYGEEASFVEAVIRGIAASNPSGWVCTSAALEAVARKPRH